MNIRSEITSKALKYSAGSYKYYSAGYACYFQTQHTAGFFDIWDNNMAITNVQNGHRIGYKYFGFGGLDAELASQFGLKPFEGTKPETTQSSICSLPRTTNSFKINVWIDGPGITIREGTKIGEVIVPANSAQR